MPELVKAFEAILDSGMSVTVIPPHVCRGYEVLSGEASKTGVRYEVANREEIPNVGEKVLHVVAEEGTCRGFRAQVADVLRALQSVRRLARAGHLAVFGDGEDGTHHYVPNRVTVEMNSVSDDCLMKLYVVPQNESPFGRPVAPP